MTKTSLNHPVTSVAAQIQEAERGRYDFTLLWTPDVMRAAEPDAAPGLFAAVREELGLKLEATRAPTDVFVVDAATRPTQNQPDHPASTRAIHSVGFPNAADEPRLAAEIR